MAFSAWIARGVGTDKAIKCGLVALGRALRIGVEPPVVFAFQGVDVPAGEILADTREHFVAEGAGEERECGGFGLLRPSVARALRGVRLARGFITAGIVPSLGTSSRRTMRSTGSPCSFSSRHK